MFSTEINIIEITFKRLCQNKKKKNNERLLFLANELNDDLIVRSTRHCVSRKRKNINSIINM